MFIKLAIIPTLEGNQELREPQERSSTNITQDLRKNRTRNSHNHHLHLQNNDETQTQPSKASKNQPGVILSLLKNPPN